MRADPCWLTPVKSRANDGAFRMMCQHQWRREEAQSDGFKQGPDWMRRNSFEGNQHCFRSIHALHDHPISKSLMTHTLIDGAKKAHQRLPGGTLYIPLYFPHTRWSNGTVCLLLTFSNEFRSQLRGDIPCGISSHSCWHSGESPRWLQCAYVNVCRCSYLAIWYW